MLLMSSIDSCKNNPNILKGLNDFLKCTGCSNACKTPVRIEEKDERLILAFWRHIWLIILGCDGEFVKEINVLVLEKVMLAKEVIEGIISLILRVIRSISLEIFICYSIQVVSFSPLWIWQKLICLLDFNELFLGFSMIWLVWMPTINSLIIHWIFLIENVQFY